MATHIENTDGARSRAHGRPDRSKQRAKAVAIAAQETPSRASTPDTLMADTSTPEEAELVAQLSAALEYAPNRHSRDALPTRQPDIASMIEAPPMRDIDDVLPSARRSKRLLLADDAELPVSAQRLKAPAWMAGRRRISWRERLSAVLAWTMTLLVIVSVIGGVGLAMLGLERALALLTIAAHELSALVAYAAAVWQILTR